MGLMSLFLPIFRALNDAKIEYVIVGGVAVVMHGHTRLTVDLDLILGITSSNWEKIVEILKSMKYAPRQPINIDEVKDPSIVQNWVQTKGVKALSFASPANPLLGIDIMVSPEYDYQGIIERAVAVKIDEITTVKIGSIDDIIKMKASSTRAKDLDDIEQLRRISNAKRK